MATSKRVIEIQVVDGVAIANIVTRFIIDDQVFQQFGDELSTLVSHQKVLLNFAKVEKFSSYALGKLNDFRKKIDAAKGKLALSNIEPAIFEAFEITGFTRLFKIFSEEQEALEYLKK